MLYMLLRLCITEDVRGEKGLLEQHLKWTRFSAAYSATFLLRMEIGHSLSRVSEVSWQKNKLEKNCKTKVSFFGFT